MGGTTEARDARRELVRQIVEAGQAGSVDDVRQVLETDHGITVSAAPVYGDMKALGLPTFARRVFEKPAGRPKQAAPKLTPAPAISTPRPGAKPAADGYQRTSLDLPHRVYERLKIAALMERRPFREIIEQAALEWLDRNNR